MKLTDKYGTTMVEVYEIQSRGDDLVMKANLMETMPADVYLKPDEAWPMVGMVFKRTVFWHLPGFLWKAWRRRKNASKPAQSPTLEDSDLPPPP